MRYRILAAAMCAVMVLAACGNSIDNTSAVPVTQSGSAEAVTSAATVPAVSETGAEAVTEAGTASPETVTETSPEAETVTETTPAAETVTGTGTETVTVTAAETVTETSETVSSSAETSKQTEEPVSEEFVLPACHAAAVYSVDDGEYIFSSNTDRKISIASTTKLITVSLAKRFFAPEDTVTVGSEVWMTKYNSTVAGLQYGNKLSFEQAIYGLLLPSGNDAAYVLAANTARKAYPDRTMTDSEAVSTFVEMMNGYAAELGMTHTHFANPEGWDDPNHYSTLDDMLIIVRQVLADPVISKAVAASSKQTTLISGGVRSWKNTNYMLDPGSIYYLPECIGVKTGTTADAGACLIAAVKRGGKTYICAVMGAADDAGRFTSVRKLIDAKLPR